jgi:cysteinyl-tRNA synthetase
MVRVEKNLVRLERFFTRFDLPEAICEQGPPAKGRLWSRFCGAMDDDFNFPRVLALIFAEIRSINRGIVSATACSDADRALRRRLIDIKGLCQNVLGLRLNRSMETPACIAKCKDVFPIHNSSLETILYPTA